jgi:hypothetical protein
VGSTERRERERGKKRALRALRSCTYIVEKTAARARSRMDEAEEMPLVSAHLILVDIISMHLICQIIAIIGPTADYLENFSSSHIKWSRN